MSAQSEKAIKDADVVLFVVDSSVGLTDDDQQVARLLQRADVPVLVVANKVDDSSHENAIWELLGLGLGDPYPVSALHGRGTGDLLDAVVAALEPSVSEPANEDGDGDSAELDDEDLISVTLVGRPNVGKSTLFNRLIGAERAVVHDRPGTTRDAIDTVADTAMGMIRFIDTAGMRRKAKIDENTEYYSLVRALRAVDASDVALLVIDATVGVTHQDQRLAERIDAAGCPIVIVFNKWDLVDTEARLDLGDDVERKLGFLGTPPVLRMSALTGKGVMRLWPSLQEAVRAYQVRIPTRQVNDAVRAAQSAQPRTGRRENPVCHPGSHRSANFHPFHQPQTAQDLRSLHRAKITRIFQSGINCSQTARTSSKRVVDLGTLAVMVFGSPDTIGSLRPRGNRGGVQ